MGRKDWLPPIPVGTRGPGNLLGNHQCSYQQPLSQGPRLYFLTHHYSPSSTTCSYGHTLHLYKTIHALHSQLHEYLRFINTITLYPSAFKFSLVRFHGTSLNIPFPTLFLAHSNGSNSTTWTYRRINAHRCYYTSIIIHFNGQRHPLDFPISQQSKFPQL